jgi:hypothetical protein
METVKLDSDVLLVIERYREAKAIYVEAYKVFEELRGHHTRAGRVVDRALRQMNAAEDELRELL